MNWQEFETKHVAPSQTHLMAGDTVSFQVYTPEQISSMMKKNQWGHEQALLTAAVRRQDSTDSVVTKVYLSPKQVIQVANAGGFDPYKDGSQWGNPVTVSSHLNSYNKQVLDFSRKV